MKRKNAIVRFGARTGRSSNAASAQNRRETGNVCTADELEQRSSPEFAFDISARTNLADSEGRRPVLLASLRLEHQEFINIDESADTILARLAAAF